VRYLFLIPARIGSKGVKRKNLRTVGGKPLIDWTINAALNSRKEGDIVAISSDSDEILSRAKSGVEKILRPKDISGDTAPMIDVISHAIEAIQDWEEFAGVVLLQPTCPIRHEMHIKQAVELFESSDCDSLISMSKEDDFHPARMYKMIDGKLSPYLDHMQTLLRQQLDSAYHRNGSVYISDRGLLSTGKIWGNSPVGFVMPREYSLNVDDEFDLMIADLLLSHQSKVC